MLRSAEFGHGTVAIWRFSRFLVNMDSRASGKKLWIEGMTYEIHAISTPRTLKLIGLDARPTSQVVMISISIPWAWVQRGVGVKLRVSTSEYVGAGALVPC